MELDPRQEQILLALVREYIQTGEPVGSGALPGRYHLEYSPATIRHEMSHLDDLGFVSQPHTSAGRVPQDKSYRYFVDRLLQQEMPAPPEAPVIRREVQQTHSPLDRAVEEISRILSELTHYSAVVLGPRLRKTFFKYLQLAPVDRHRVLMVLLTTTGGMVNHVIELSQPVSPRDLERFTNVLNDRLRGLPIDAISQELMEGAQGVIPAEVLTRLRQATDEATLQEEPRVFQSGAAQLCDFPEFQDVHKLRAVLDILYEERVIAEILEKTLDGNGVQVTIGSEHPHEEMRDCTMVSAVYRLGGTPIGSLGIVGPTRMPYDRVIAIVQYLAEQVTSRLESLTSP